jgi:hypothetical protein
VIVSKYFQPERHECSLSLLAMPSLFYSRSARPIRDTLALDLKIYNLFPDLPQATYQSLPLSRPNDIRIHPRQMVINRILLHRFRSLPPTIIRTCPPFPLSILRRSRLTGASIQALNCVSNAAHPAAVYPDEAQHAVIPSVSSQIQRGEGGGDGRAYSARSS